MDSILTFEFFYKWIGLPILIMLARVVDVSIYTLRIIYLTNNKKITASVLGFFEVIIWLVAIGQIMNNLDNYACYIGYGAGFALGTYVGLLIEEKIAAGIVAVRIITQKGATDLIDALKKEDYSTTIIDAKGNQGKVNVIFTTVSRRKLARMVELINFFNPKAFYTVEPVKFVNEGMLPIRNRRISVKHRTAR